MKSQISVVFDLGGVLLNWNPQKLIEQAGANVHEAALLQRHVFEHQDWLELDRGTLTREMAQQRAIERSDLKASLVERLFDLLPSSLEPIPAMVKNLESLVDQGVPCYVLSNMHEASARFLEQNCDFWPLFEGTLFSCDEKLIKPERAIYERVEEKFDLKGPNIVFLDDTQDNIRAAKQQGWGTIHVQASVDVRGEFARWGLLPN
ncbi:MAG: HAD family phosphatase [Spirochaetales bacterium]|nr:HAD family phosphatase [Spirochaetales bacterium]